MAIVRHFGDPGSLGEANGWSGRVYWPTCGKDGCIGVRLDTGKCVAHAEDQAREAALEQVAQTGIVDARGVRISRELLVEILAAAPSGPDGHRMFKGAGFNEATFTDAVFQAVGCLDDR